MLYLSRNVMPYVLWACKSEALHQHGTMFLCYISNVGDPDVLMCFKV